MNLEQLISELSQKLTQEPYQAKSAADIQREAEQRYQSVYNDMRQSARRSWEKEDAALAQELTTLQSAYDRERADAQAETRQTYAQADRQALSRGMQRSSYLNATLANIGLSGDQALRGISASQTQAEHSVAQKRTQLADELGDLLRQYDADQRSDVLRYADELSAREYERAAQSQTEYNNMTLKLYEYRRQLEQEAQEQARWQAEFNAKYGGGTAAPAASSGSSSGSSRASTPAPEPDPEPEEKTTVKKKVSNRGTVRNQRAMLN